MRMDELFSDISVARVFMRQGLRESDLRKMGFVSVKVVKKRFPEKNRFLGEYSI